ncbi:hypothetical protein HELRODRAFT_163465 [Helobdella robusta]|uniref:Uncharacterized protein n=1 Tax=Helobdella robusta TaxID=6412 RepID=T1EU33_HELRO|nr:hypothetical protein HELRODRAFT_163465 [Helobdella robusta]ESN96404.1 hypothetical protein HELRODRAFT_163465 [Helobdella robusta]
MSNRNSGLCGGFYHFMSPDGLHDDRDIQVRDICTAISQHTTCTGLPHIYRSRGVIKRAGWFLITLAAIAGLVFQLYEQVSSYVQFRVDIVITVQTDYQLAFPSVTICNMNPIKKSSLTEYLYNVSTADGSFRFKRKKRSTSYFYENNFD